jgi:NAD(P)-dependent dehydrogenase (short-subunit alcohol dehydrogenase family)
MDGAVAVVTGGARGIGRATALALADAGAVTVVADLDAEASAEKVAEIGALGGRAWAHAADVTREDSVDALFAAAAEREGRIDVLVNNAGIAIRRPAVDLSLDDWDKVVAVNMTGMFLCARSVARHMIARGAGGAVVNVASIMGISGGGLYPVAPTYVRTRLIAPLLESAELTARIVAMTPLGRLAEPEDVAAAIAFLASPAAGMITGCVLPVDGGFLAQ